MRVIFRQALPWVWGILLLGLMLPSCQAFQEPPEGVLTPQELIFTSAAGTMIANLTPDHTAERPTDTPQASPTTSPTPAATIPTTAPTPAATIPPPTTAPTSTPAATVPPPTAPPSPTDVPPTATEEFIPTTTPVDTAVPANALPALPAATATPLTNLVFEDDFSNTTVWHTETRPGFNMYYQEGGYRIHNQSTNSNVSSIRTFDYLDSQVEVDATLISGPADGYFGTVCRWQDTQNNYAFVLRDAGFHGIVKNQNGEATFLAQGRTENGPIHGGGDTNRIRGICLGDHLILEVNGQRLLEAEDSTFGSGYVGVLVVTQDQPGTLVHFDNFALFAP